MNSIARESLALSRHDNDNNIDTEILNNPVPQPVVPAQPGGELLKRKCARRPKRYVRKRGSRIVNVYNSSSSEVSDDEECVRPTIKGHNDPNTSKISTPLTAPSTDELNDSLIILDQVITIYSSEDESVDKNDRNKSYLDLLIQIARDNLSPDQKARLSAIPNTAGNIAFTPSSAPLPNATELMHQQLPTTQHESVLLESATAVYQSNSPMDTDVHMVSLDEIPYNTNIQDKTPANLHVNVTPVKIISSATIATINTNTPSKKHGGIDAMCKELMLSKFPHIKNNDASSNTTSLNQTTYSSKIDPNYCDNMNVTSDSSKNSMIPTPLTVTDSVISASFNCHDYFDSNRQCSVTPSSINDRAMNSLTLSSIDYNVITSVLSKITNLSCHEKTTNMPQSQVLTPSRMISYNNDNINNNNNSSTAISDSLNRLTNLLSGIVTTSSSPVKEKIDVMYSSAYQHPPTSAFIAASNCMYSKTTVTNPPNTYTININYFPSSLAAKIPGVVPQRVNIQKLNSLLAGVPTLPNASVIEKGDLSSHGIPGSSHQSLGHRLQPPNLYNHGQRPHVILVTASKNNNTANINTTPTNNIYVSHSMAKSQSITNYNSLLYQNVQPSCKATINSGPVPQQRSLPPPPILKSGVHLARPLQPPSPAFKSHRFHNSYGSSRPNPNHVSIMANHTNNYNHNFNGPSSSTISSYLGPVPFPPPHHQQESLISTAPAAQTFPGRLSSSGCTSDLVTGRGHVSNPSSYWMQEPYFASASNIYAGLPSSLNLDIDDDDDRPPPLRRPPSPLISRRARKK